MRRYHKAMDGVLAHDGAWVFHRDIIERDAEAVRSLKWIRECALAHHSGQEASQLLWSLTVDLPHYLDYVLALFEEDDNCV